MLQEVEFKSAIQIKSAITTKGSAPLEVLCDDGELYFIKTMALKHPPFPELINELLCNYLCQCFGLAVALPMLVRLPQIVVSSFLKEGNILDERYHNVNFDDTLFFGAKSIKNATEFEKYNARLNNKHDFNRFSKPLDLIKIGIFDFWIGNKDRMPSNPNIIISPSKEGFMFNPIDHTAAFGYQANYKGLNKSQMFIEDSKNILSTPISKSILKFAFSKNNHTLRTTILDCIDTSLDNLGFVFNQIPPDWGLSKAGKQDIFKVLSDKERNATIAQTYYRFKNK